MLNGFLLAQAEESSNNGVIACINRRMFISSRRLCSALVHWVLTLWVEYGHCDQCESV